MGINIINCLSTGCEHSLDLSWPENKIMPDHGRGRGLGIGFGFGNRYRRLDLLIDDRRMLGGPGSTPVARKDTRCHSLCKKKEKKERKTLTIVQIKSVIGFRVALRQQQEQREIDLGSDLTSIDQGSRLPASPQAE